MNTAVPNRRTHGSNNILRELLFARDINITTGRPLLGSSPSRYYGMMKAVMEVEARATTSTTPSALSHNQQPKPQGVSGPTEPPSRRDPPRDPPADTPSSGSSPKRATAQGLELLRAASLLTNVGGRYQETKTQPQAATKAKKQGSPATKSKSSIRRAQTDSEKINGERSYVEDVKEADVLCGRGGRSNHHPGNKRYRQVVSEMKLSYRTTEARATKTDLSRAIVDHVCNYGGRFLKKDETSDRYYIVPKAEARKKTSQALRETKTLKWT